MAGARRPAAGGSPPPHETALAAGAAAVASAQVLAHLDGTRPAAAGALVELALPQVLPVARPLRAHRRCGCMTLSRE
ncbi:hypothetical protein [Xylanimonas allomyrinae]|uniref:hypothetical protein n=1 Tax=Xylanimonas allomyrinae TaxID=2509459 RepID=UPI001FECB92D|nr:hypothetical protein [Xylanimonas allomyrinae]